MGGKRRENDKRKNHFNASSARQPALILEQRISFAFFFVCLCRLPSTPCTPRRRTETRTRHRFWSVTLKHKSSFQSIQRRPPHPLSLPHIHILPILCLVSSQDAQRASTVPLRTSFCISFITLSFLHTSTGDRSGCHSSLLFHYFPIPFSRSTNAQAYNKKGRTTARLTFGDHPLCLLPSLFLPTPHPSQEKSLPITLAQK